MEEGTSNTEAGKKKWSINIVGGYFLRDMNYEIITSGRMSGSIQFTNTVEDETIHDSGVMDRKPMVVRGAAPTIYVPMEHGKS